MALSGEYEPSPEQWVRDQVAAYESSGGSEGTTLRGVPVVVVTSGKATCAIDETVSAAVALRVKDPAPAGRK